MKQITTNIRSFMQSNENYLTFAFGDVIYSLEKDSSVLVLKYKQNDMKKFGFGLSVNFEDLRENVVVAVLLAFIKY